MCRFIRQFIAQDRVVLKGKSVASDELLVSGLCVISSGAVRWRQKKSVLGVEVRNS
jgi:hypothetical protein